MFCALICDILNDLIVYLLYFISKAKCEKSLEVNLHKPMKKQICLTGAAVINISSYTCAFSTMTEGIETECFQHFK